MNAPESPDQHDADLALLKRETDVVEARLRLAGARRQLAETEAGLSKLRQPWWRSRLTVTALTAIVAAVVPITTQIQSWRDQALKEKEMNFSIRDKYFSAVIQDARREKRVLEFIIATADDSKIQTWASAEIKTVSQRIVSQDAIIALRKKLYFEAMTVIAGLSDSNSTQSEQESKRIRFWELYRRDLLPVESADVEGLMVKIGREVSQGTPNSIAAIEDLSYQLARQMKAEIEADAQISMPSIPKPE